MVRADAAPGRLRPRTAARLALLLAAGCLVLAAPTRAALGPDDTAVLVLRGDEASALAGRYYAHARGIPAERVYEIPLPGGDGAVPPEAFARAWEPLRARLPGSVRLLVLAWTEPWRVGCMAVTSAFALGFDGKWCADGCRPTALNPLAAGAGEAGSGFRYAMLLPSDDALRLRRLVSRGTGATAGAGAVAFLARSDDARRSVRGPASLRAAADPPAGLPVRVGALREARTGAPLLLFQIGATGVPEPERLPLAPGALADHLTSFGGVLSGGSQMSALRWLDAGASATYGTVVEPCNFPGKFPDPYVLAHRYAAGDTAVEAYWRSVLMPGQGLFVGDALVAPFRAPGGRGGPR